MKPLLEIAAFNSHSAAIAAAAGADRIELCIDYTAGGLTPDDDTIMAARTGLSCPFFVMIRPRAGNFVYTQAEQETMKTDLLRAKALGANGFVFGILKADNTIDEAANKELVSLAHPLSCTFHRAFDDIADKPASLETLVRCGFQRVLTSGGRGNAVAYTDQLRALVLQAEGRIVVLPGGGIRATNIREIRELTGASEFHSAAITGPGVHADPETIQAMNTLLKMNPE